MSNLTIIIIVAVIFLLLIGATQRKRLVLLLRSETNAVVKNATNNVKVLDLKLVDLKAAVRKMVDAAGGVFAQILKTEKDIERMKIEMETYLSDAKKAKENGEEDTAKAKLEAYLQTKKSIELAEADLVSLKKKKTQLEVSITRLKLKQNTFSNQIEMLRGRDAVNKALKEINGISALDGESIQESIQAFDDKSSFEESKLTYIEGSTVESFSADIDKEYENL